MTEAEKKAYVALLQSVQYVAELAAAQVRAMVVGVEADGALVAEEVQEIYGLVRHQEQLLVILASINPELGEVPRVDEGGKGA